MEDKKPENQPSVEKETSPPPAAESDRESQKPSPVNSEPEKAPSKPVQYIRSGLIWLGVIVAAFLLGMLVYHFARFRPVNNSLEETSQTLEGEQARAEELADQLESANRRISTLESDIENLNGDLDAAEIHIELLRALLEINTAHIALANQDVAGAKVALTDTARRFETLKTSIASVDSALAENISQRLELINSNMENDPETAMADLGLLANNLQNVETLLFGE